MDLFNVSIPYCFCLSIVLVLGATQYSLKNMIECNKCVQLHENVFIYIPQLLIIIMQGI